MHFASFVGDGGVGVGSCVVEEVGDAVSDVGYVRRAECGGDGADRGQHGCVDGSGVVEEEGSEEFLGPFSFGWCERYVWWGVGHLRSFAVVGGGPWVGGVLRFGWGIVFEAFKGLFYVAWDG